MSTLAAAVAATWLAAAGCSRAEAFESFTLSAQDHLIAEAAGCSAECRISGNRRVCVLRDPECRAVCKVLPECRPDGAHAIQACATIRIRP